MKEAPPFMYTAVDFTGPLFLRGKEANDSTKVWICLFTCCVSRAIHLELVLDMSTATFIRCVKRFAARRGLLRRFLSDNAKTFKSAAKVLKTICDHPDVRSYLSLAGIDWNFNLEKAPWWGGLFERMVRSTKRCLRKVVGRAKFSYDEMHSAVVEIEAIVNSRPLAYLHPDDLEQPLTPSHLLVGRRLLSLPDHLTYLEPEGDEDFELTTESLQRRAKHLNSVLNHFWRRWSREYLLELKDTDRQRSTGNSHKSVKAGDMVLVHNQPQGVLEDGESAESNYRQGWRGPWSSTEGCIQQWSANQTATTPTVSEVPTTEPTEPECESAEQQAASFKARDQPPNSSRPRREAAV